MDRKSKLTELVNNNLLIRYYKKKRIETLKAQERSSIELLKNNDYDIFHPTYYNPYFLKYLNNKPYVLTIYDMIHEMYPEYFPLNDETPALKKELAEKATKIIAISKNTKKDIIKYYGINSNKIDVIYLGNSLCDSEISNKIDRNIIGTMQKNISYLLEVEKYTKTFTFLLKLSSSLTER